MIFRTANKTRRPSSPATAEAAAASAAVDAPEGHQLTDDGGARPDDPTTRVSWAATARLDEAVAGLGPFLTETFIPTSAVINPLLVVWDAANEIDPCVSSPVERLLTVLVARTWVRPSELTATLDEVRAAASQASLLIEALASA